jgi:hypothetical protein
MKFKVIKEFSWAFRGVEIISFNEGDPLETEDEELIKVAKQEGWISAQAGVKNNENKSHLSPAKKTVS